MTGVMVCVQLKAGSGEWGGGCEKAVPAGKILSLHYRTSRGQVPLNTWGTRQKPVFQCMFVTRVLVS